LHPFPISVTLVDISFLGAAGEVGRSCIMLSGDDRIMLDCGLKIHASENYPLEPPEMPDFAIISHAHLDHSGFTPGLFRGASPEVICTPPTLALAEIIVEDSRMLMEKRGERPYETSHIKKFVSSTTSLSFNKRYEIGESNTTLYSAGHITGASIVDVETSGKRVVYSGDFKLEETRTTFPSDIPPKNPDALIIESTYSDRDHPPRKDLEIELGRQMNETLDEGGTVLFPAFAIGRTQELMRIVRSQNRDVEIFIDGMGWRVSETLSHYSSYVKDFKRFRTDFGNCHHVMGKRDKEKIVKKPCVIISTAGMLQGGPALSYLLKLAPESRAIFTGYSVPETNGYNLLNSGYVEYDGVKIKPKAKWSYLDFSAHAGRTELFKLVEELSPSKVYCVHGDKCQDFADALALEGFDTYAPKLGETVQV
jgi:putative mRNA 3-end processing factor